MITASKKVIYVVAGWLCVVIGFIGIFLPILPTTPLMILAAFCFSKGSQRMRSWLLSQPKIGPAILDWEENRVIRIRAKILSTILIVLTFSCTLIFVNVGLVVKVLVALCGVGTLAFIWTRKSLPEPQLAPAAHAPHS